MKPIVNTRYLRSSQSQPKLEPQIIRPGSETIETDDDGQSVVKRRPTIILKRKDNKPYLLVKTTRVKEEEKQRNQLGNVLHPAVNTKSQTVLKYRRAFGDIVDMPGN